jgi:hypothetical protein
MNQFLLLDVGSKQPFVCLHLPEARPEGLDVYKYLTLRRKPSGLCASRYAKKLK